MPPTKATSTSTTASPKIEVSKPIDSDTKKEDAIKTEASNSLPPPPRPLAGNTPAPDYFSQSHGLNHEANPFEYNFRSGGGQQSTSQTLPSVADLTSPRLPGGPNRHPWMTAGLQTGPLSPAMLTGPTKEDDYFSDGHHLRGGFPTPNESGLRSGLTPGGGGSMFPEPSPNTTSLFNSLAAGGATPGTMEFHRTAIELNQKRKFHEALAQQKPPQQITSQPQDMNGMDVKPPTGIFDETNDAANGLYLLAQARNGPNSNHYSVAPQNVVHAHPQAMMGGQSSETSPVMANRNNGSISTHSGRGASEMSGFSEEEQPTRPNTRGKGKRNGGDTQANGRRKANDQPAKAPANKKAKANNGMSMSMEPPSEDELDMSKEEYNANGKKMTDDEKRKNFLERNRVAALKCRQRKKQWLANLQQKVEMYSVENDNLSNTVGQLREELVNLKTLLLAHKDCPVSQAQGLNNGNMQHLIEGYGNQHMNPYGMANQQQHQQQQMMAGPGFQRRES